MKQSELAIVNWVTEVIWHVENWTRERKSQRASVCVWDRAQVDWEWLITGGQKHRLNVSFLILLVFFSFIFWWMESKTCGIPWSDKINCSSRKYSRQSNCRWQTLHAPLWHRLFPLHNFLLSIFTLVARYSCRFFLVWLARYIPYAHDEERERKRERAKEVQHFNLIIVISGTASTMLTLFVPMCTYNSLREWERETSETHKKNSNWIITHKKYDARRIGRDRSIESEI